MGRRCEPAQAVFARTLARLLRNVRPRDIMKMMMNIIGEQGRVLPRRGRFGLFCPVKPFANRLSRGYDATLRQYWMIATYT